ncbi:MAG: hypothetical protein H0X33_12110 [Taibaiella sp.]|nr:hypothetical protein [Taibaiella sp.]
MKYVVILCCVFSATVTAQVKNISFNFNQISCQTVPSSLIGQDIYFYRPNPMFTGKQPDADTLMQGFISERTTPINSAIPAEYVGRIKEGGWSLFDNYTGSIKPYDYAADPKTYVYRPALGVSNMKHLLLFSTYSSFANRLFTIVNCTDSVTNGGHGCLFAFTLKDDKGELLHWSVDSHLVGYFSVCFKSYINYLKETYSGKKFYLKRESGIPVVFFNPLDKMTYAPAPGEEWNCSDMTLLNDPGKFFPYITLLFQVGEKTISVIPDNQKLATEPLRINALWTPEQYADYKAIEKIRHDSLTKARNAQEKLVMKKQAAHAAEVLNKYGKVYGRYILRGEVAKGMTRTMCIAAWGDLANATKGTAQGHEIELWEYSRYRWLRFNDGKLEYYNE